MEQYPLLSVCLITYNHFKYIKQAIDGVLMQKVDFSWELIIADDFSTDGTREILLEYKKKYPQFITLILQEKNVGAAQNWLDLITSPKSKYIAYLEGDDYWTDENKLQKQIDFLEENEGYSGCFHYTQILNEDAILGRLFREHYSTLDFGVEDTISDVALFHTSSFLFMKKALELPLWFQKISSGDMALFSIVAAKGRLRCLPETMSVYRHHIGGITKSKGLIEYYNEDRIKLMNFLDEFHNYKYHRKVNEVIEIHRYYIYIKTSIWVRLKSKIKRITKWL